MEKTTLKFSTLCEMKDFQAIVKTAVIFSNTSHLTLTAEFCEADIELAREGFGATIVELPTT
jgi:hypothetical protein